MVTLTTAENALKQVYLGVLANQLNVGVSPIYSMMPKTTKDILGKEIVKLAPFGINGGFSAGSETDPLPKPSSTQYLQFRSSLKNLYGKIEISDKAIRAASNDVGAFVDILANEMDELVKGCTFNLSRMLWGDGSGKLATLITADTGMRHYGCDSVRNLVEGMVVDVYRAGEKVSTVTIKAIVRESNSFFVTDNSFTLLTDDVLYVQNSKDKELTGLGALWNDNNPMLYGCSKDEYRFLRAYSNNKLAEISDIRMQEVIDFLEDSADSQVNVIACSRKIRRAYQQYLEIYRRNIDIAELSGGYKTITHNGIPVIADKFVEEGNMYFLNTNDFVLHQLCDWKWLEDESGRVLRQNENYPTYSATLVKYADLICERPVAQGRLTNIKSTVTGA